MEALAKIKQGIAGWTVQWPAYTPTGSSLNIARAAFTRIACGILIALAWLRPASAGTINFTFELRDTICYVTNSGDSSAYYPVIFKLGRDGTWTGLKSDLQPAELPPGETLAVRMAESDRVGSAPAIQSDLVSLQPLLIRFFDQAGVSFGQVTLLRPPPINRYTIKTGYANGRLRLEAPPEGSTIRATWVLAPFEEGIAPISRSLSFTHDQPPAARIEWHQKQSAEIDAGAAMSSAMLLHETADGLSSQTVQIIRAKRIEQRTKWLYMKRSFYIAGGLCGLCGFLLSTKKSDRKS